MRSLFHFPFPCTQPPSQQPSPTATVPLQPEMSHRPHPAPVRHRRHSPALLSAARPLPGPALTSIRPTAHCHPLPGRPSCRAPLSRCVGPGALAGKNRTACIPFSPNARKRPPSWQHPPEMHAFRDQDGNIFALCIHFRAQSGDSGYMARESCRQGPSFASRNPKSRMARRCCQRRAAFPRQRHAVPVPMHLATCAPHPSRQPRGPTASRKQAEQRKQLNAGIKIGSPNGDPIEELFGLRSVCPTPYSPYTKRTNLRFPTWITAPDRDSGATL